MGRAKNIAQGWGAWMFAKDKPYARERGEICKGCPNNKYKKYLAFTTDNQIGYLTGHICEACGCPLSAKVRSKHEECPIGKW